MKIEKPLDFEYNHISIFYVYDVQLCSLYLDCNRKIIALHANKSDSKKHIDLNTTSRTSATYIVKRIKSLFHI